MADPEPEPSKRDRRLWGSQELVCFCGRFFPKK